MEAQLEQVAAFKELLGLQSLPSNGKQAAAASQQFSSALLSTIRPAPIFSQLVQQHAYSKAAVKARFIDVSTGMRLRYLQWPGSEDVVLLLHDATESADVWAPLAEKLRLRGYRVFAIDLRGHGESQWSSGGRYSLDLLAEDVQAFILEKDLYTRPVAVVGCGLGGAVALTLAQQNPHLVGAAVVAEFTIPLALQSAWEAGQRRSTASSAGDAGSDGLAGERRDGAAGHGMRQRTEAVKAPRPPAQGSQEASGNGGGPALHSGELLPWWGFSLPQAATFYSVEECAALLCHPLANLGPEALLPLSRAAAAVAAAAAAAAAAAEAEAAGGTGGGGSDSGMGARDGEAGGDAAGGGAQQMKGSGAVEAQGEQGLGTSAEAPAGKSMQEVLEGLQRPLAGAVRSAFAMLRVPGGSGAGASAWEAPNDGLLALRMDPQFFISFDAGELLSRMAAVRCHLLVLRGEASPWSGPGDAARLAALAAAGGARSARAALLPGAGHRLASDHEPELLQALVNFLDGPAISCFQVGAGGQGEGGRAEAGMMRRPELLDLKPLPQFDTLEQAKKALGPRSIPTAAAIKAELEKLRLEAGDEASDDEEQDGLGSRQTALAKDPPDYFGFVG